MSLIPGITLPPDAPDIADPETFEDKAQAFVEWQVQFVSDFNATAQGYGVTKWAAGTYALGDMTWSPLNFRTYRKITASSATVTDPSADSTNWQLLDMQSFLQALTCYYLPSMADGWRGLYRAGLDWWSRNQQWGGPWGGEMVNAATGTPYRVEFATGYVDCTEINIGLANDAAHTYVTQGFKVPETQTISAIWVRLCKVGNPTGNMQLQIQADDGTGQKPTGTTAITNGTATAIGGKQFVGGAAGMSDPQWYRFAFATPPSCTGGTQYHFVLKSSAAVDGSNYWAPIVHGTDKKYPFGNISLGDATPTYTATTTRAVIHLVELSSTGKMLQSGGAFDGKLAFGGSGASGTLSMSRGLCNAPNVRLGELINPQHHTGWLVGAALTKDSTILDIGYGENHDRIVLRSNITTGYLQMDVYDSAGTKTTKTATAVDLSSGTHYIGWSVRAMGDGADYVAIYVDGTPYSTTGLTIALDDGFAVGNVGTMWLGGGFALAPTYGGSSIGINGFSGIPSTLGWTHTTAAGTEANQYSVSGGKLYQNRNGFASTDNGYYLKAWAASNVNGWNAATKLRVVSAGNSVDDYAYFEQDDGVARPRLSCAEYFCYGVGSTTNYIQNHFRPADVVIHAMGKGSDFFQFANRRLINDGSGLIGTGTVSNRIRFGDNSATAAANADVVWSYMNYYTTAWVPPQFTGSVATPASISDFSIWQGDMRPLWALLYNGGNASSVKALLGVPSNYLDKSSKLKGYFAHGTSAGSTTTSSTSSTADACECYFVGDWADVNYGGGQAFATGVGEILISDIRVDGVQAWAREFGYISGQAGGANWGNNTVSRVFNYLTLGLHKAAGLIASSSGGSCGFNAQQRHFHLQPKL